VGVKWEEEAELQNVNFLHGAKPSNQIFTQEKRKSEQSLALELNKSNKKGYIWRTNIDNSIKLG